MGKKNENEKHYNDGKYRRFRRATVFFVSDYNRFIENELRRLSLDDDEHIARYMFNRDAKQLCDDLLSRSGGNIYAVSYFIEELKLAVTDKEGVTTYRKLPFSRFCEDREEAPWAKAIIVKDGKAYVDEDLLKQTCLITLNEKTRRIYEATERFLGELEAVGITNKDIIDRFFIVGRDRKTKPNFESIAFTHS